MMWRLFLKSKTLKFKRPDGTIREVPNGSAKEANEIIVLSGNPKAIFKPGTVLAKGLKRIGFKPCGGCVKRAKKLDQMWAKLAK